MIFDKLSKKMLLSCKSMNPDIVNVPIQFNYTGKVQTYQVPAGCRKLKVDCVGACGGSHSGSIARGNGGRVECILTVKPEQILYIYCGGAGASRAAGNAFNGGGTIGSYSQKSNGGGGGASDIRTVEGDLDSRLVVAGGAGGYGSNASGGQGGGLIGGRGRDANNNEVAWGGQGGSQTEGGAVGVGGQGNLTAGAFGQGGNNTNSNVFGGMIGAGGGGWYGGGCGGYSGGGGGGGGGSSYTAPGKCTAIVHTQGYSQATGHGWIILTPIK